MFDIILLSIPLLLLFFGIFLPISIWLWKKATQKRK